MVDIGTAKEGVEAIEPHIQWFERNHNAVAEVSKSDRWENPDNAVTITAIAGVDADMDVIKRGLHGIQYRLSEMADSE
jgi:hypothetical protein